MEYDDIKKLMDDMGDSKLDSIDIEFPDGIKISMKRNKANSNTKTKNSDVMEEKVEAFPNENQEETNSNGKSITEEKADDTKIITSPMVGTFYTSSNPSNPPFVKVGDIVKKGDTLCIIEAMKLMNEIESEYDGEIIEIFVKNEDMVEYGMPMFRIK